MKNGCNPGKAINTGQTDTHYTWSCQGLNSGTTATNCQKTRPASINGVCNNSQRNSCSAGTANDAAIADTTTLYKWHCVGVNTTATNCQKAKPAPVNGVCNNSQRNGCSTGTANDDAIDDTNTHYRWQCVGANGGTTATNCQKAKAAPVNGVCNNSQRNSCSIGTANDAAIADTATLYRWHCVGANSGTTARDCQKAIPINGVCNNTVKNGCTSGTLLQVDLGTDDYIWHCVGSGGGTTGTCSTIISLNGVCNNTVKNGCISGTFQDQPDSNTKYLWFCIGSGGGTTHTCSKSK